MGGKSRKTGKVSKKLIEKLKRMKDQAVSPKHKKKAARRDDRPAFFGSGE